MPACRCHSALTRSAPQGLQGREEEECSSTGAHKDDECEKEAERSSRLRVSRFWEHFLARSVMEFDQLYSTLEDFRMQYGIRIP